MKKRKKKQHPQTSELYICMHCSTLVSPEWRKGPDGPKTLCNACGCRLTISKRPIIIANCNSALVKREEEIMSREEDIVDSVSKGWQL
jgi:DNA-directed RNA polymerase subunit RPC12/RpoP